MEDKETEKLGKLIEMAKQGTPNEKEIAINFIQKICKKHDLIFEEVMSKKELQEFVIDYKKKKFQTLAFHIYARYGVVDEDHYDVGGFLRGNKIWYKTTLSKHIEMLNAFDILSRIFEKEQKLIKDAFTIAFMRKHRLYLYTNKAEDPKKPTEEELKKSKIADSIVEDLESAEILKRLK